MKIDKDTRFPHPVLSHDTGDYLSGEFSIQISVEEKFSPSQVSIDCAVNLTEPTLLQAVEDGKASVGLFVSCLDAYFSRLIPLGLAGGKIEFEPGELIGRVQLRPMVWARQKVDTLSLQNCHPEFGETAVSLAAGAVLAVDDEVAINVGREKLAQMETIFSLAEVSDLEPGQLSLRLDSERITIAVASDIYQRLNLLRGRAGGPPIILNSVYLPAVMQVLDGLRVDEGTYDGRRWHKVFMAKCEHLGIEPRTADLWRDSQRLLAMPFKEITNSTDIFGD